MILRTTRFLTGLLTIIGAGAVAAQDVPHFNVSSAYTYFTAADVVREFGTALKGAARGDRDLAGTVEYVTFEIIGPGVEAGRAMAPENPSWPDSEMMTPLCGIETGQRLWLMAVDDGSGTPVDWTRQEMLHRDGEPMRIYARLAPFAYLVMSRIADAQGVDIKVFGAANDAEALMQAKRAGSGFALIDARNANARGFALALDINGPGTPDAPGAIDLGITDLPEPVLTVNVVHEAADVARAAAERACAAFGEQALNQQQVYDWQAAVALLAEQARGAD